MIPFRDNQAGRRLTLINLMLIAANIAVFVYEASLGGNVAAFIYQYAMIPAHITATFEGAHGLAGPPTLETILTSMFLHGGILHLAGNMLYLFIFGAAVEEALGHLRYLIFYLLCGIASALAMVAFLPHSTLPVIGASGAIAGVLGAYFVLYPRAKITTILPILILIYFVDIPAIVYLLVWFVAQLYAGVSERADVAGGVAWWAHVGGFLVGMLLGPLLTKTASAGRRRRA